MLLYALENQKVHLTHFMWLCSGTKPRISQDMSIMPAVGLSDLNLRGEWNLEDGEEFFMVLIYISFVKKVKHLFKCLLAI